MNFLFTSLLAHLFIFLACATDKHLMNVDKLKSVTINLVKRKKIDILDEAKDAEHCLECMQNTILQVIKKYSWKYNLYNDERLQKIIDSIVLDLTLEFENAYSEWIQYPSLQENDIIMINNGEEYFVDEIIVPKKNEMSSKGACNLGVYSLKKEHNSNAQLILKFPQDQASYYHELKTYEVFKNSKYITNLIAKEVTIEGENYNAFVTPKLSMDKNDKNFEIIFKNMIGLLKDVIERNYFLGDINSHNFGYNEKEKVFQVFDIGVSFKIPNTSEGFDRIKHTVLKNVYFEEEEWPSHVEFALNNPDLGAYHFNAYDWIRNKSIYKFVHTQLISLELKTFGHFLHSESSDIRNECMCESEALKMKKLLYEHDEKKEN